MRRHFCSKINELFYETKPRRAESFLDARQPLHDTIYTFVEKESVSFG